VSGRQPYLAVDSSDSGASFGGPRSGSRHAECGRGGTKCPFLPSYRIFIADLLYGFEPGGLGSRASLPPPICRPYGVLLLIPQASAFVDARAAALDGEAAWVLFAGNITAMVAIPFAMWMARSLAVGDPSVGV
jgi:hypothetical protein